MMSMNGESIYGCSAISLPKPEWGYYTRNENQLFAHILQQPVGPICLRGLGGMVRRATACTMPSIRW